MIDLKALENSLHAIVEPLVIASDATAILIIEPNDGVIPNTSYATMKIESLKQTGLTIVGEVKADGNIPVRAEYDISFKFESFGPNSKNIISNIAFSVLNNFLVQDSLLGINLFQFNTPIVTDIPVYVDTVWEERNQTTVAFHYAHEELVQVSVIEEATLNGTYEDITGAVVLTTTQTIITP